MWFRASSVEALGKHPRKVLKDGEGSGGEGRRCLSSNYPHKDWAPPNLRSPSGHDSKSVFSLAKPH